MPEQPTPIDIARAATSDPLGSETITFAGREFSIVDLKYKASVKFTALMRPLLESVAGRVAGATMDTDLLSGTLMAFCTDSLPEMASIALSQTDPSMTPQAVMDLAKSPFELTGIVIAQMQRNNLLEGIVSFFRQLIPVMKVASPMLAGMKSTTKATR